MIDSDVIPPNNIQEMQYNNVDICCAWVCVTRGSEIIPVGMTKNESGYYHDFEHSKPELHKVDAVGTGCIMIHRSVFEKIEKPYFRFIYNEDGFLINGEDFDFCERSNSDIYFDGRFRCKHLVNHFI